MNVSHSFKTAIKGLRTNGSRSALTILGIVIGIVNLVTKKDHTIPYGPFLSLAALLSLFWADKIIKLILP